jgi:LacI family transcriptional regulator
VVTVSKVLRNHDDISPATKKRVLKRIKELNYQPDWIARSMVTRRTYIIGLVVPDLMHSFFAEVAKGVTRAIRPMGYNVMISNSEEDPEVERAEIDLLLARRVDGLILASAQRLDGAGMFDRIRNRNTPFVLIDRKIPGLAANYVGVDDEKIGQIATEHLIAQGCQRIAHIRGPDITTGIGRLNGYQNALRRHGLQAPPGYVVGGTSNFESGYQEVLPLLSLNPRPDGIFCYNDPVAAGAIKRILESGVKVPETIALVGAGNVHYSDLLRVPLSTVDQSSSVIGESAAELLLQVIESKRQRSPKAILIDPRLIVRDSSLRHGASL